MWTYILAYFEVADTVNESVFIPMKWWIFIPIPKKGNVKECLNYRTIALISHASKVMLRILQARLQQYVNRNCELPDIKLVLEKAEELEIKLPASIESGL